MKILDQSALSAAQLQSLCERPAAQLPDVTPIMEAVQRAGDRALLELSERHDGVRPASLWADADAPRRAWQALSAAQRRAMKTAADNITAWHSERPRRRRVRIMPGISCHSETRPIERIGIYAPGGSAPLPSTVLMLAIPATLAGCGEIVLASPPQADGRVAPLVLAAAWLCGLRRVLAVGGAQAVAALALGTASVPRVDKIFGPGNSWVTAAKVWAQARGTAIDLPAGPTEVLVIADRRARPDFVAADLLAQAEHGADSQAILVTPCGALAVAVAAELERQLQSLPRAELARRALDNSFILQVPDLPSAMEFSNRYAPEHLILNIARPGDWVPRVRNAGTVFLGPWACEAIGDYASGVCHVLPTFGAARACGGVGLASFQKTLSFQRISRSGARGICATVAELAACEGLEAHRRSMLLRMPS